MKKLICLAIALVLCIGSVAMAEFVPSKSTADMAAANEVKTETGVAVADDFKVEPVSDSVATQEQAEQCAQMIGEISAAMTTGSVVDYFGDLQDNSGETVSLEEILGTDKPVVNEIMPLSVHSRMLTRNLLYTAISRSIKQLILVGSDTALSVAMQTLPTERRSMLVAKTHQIQRMNGGTAA